MRQTPKPFEIYRHFKGKTYQIINIAKHSETMEAMVVYQQLYAPFEMYVRPLDMFMSEVDHVKYPEVTQKYRFEKIEADDKSDTSVKETVVEPLTKETTEVCVPDVTEQENDEPQIHPKLMEFLEADSYEEKLDILSQMKTILDDSMIDTMAVSLDIEVKDGEIDRRYNELKNCLLTMEHFECNRLR